MSEENEPTEPSEASYPLGRGYGHDYMRGGEVLGGYGYSERDGYERRRGDDGAFQGDDRRAQSDEPTSESGSGGDAT